jgi:hypothetical protein
MFGERPVDGAASSPEVRSVSDESRVGRQRDRSAAEQCGNSDRGTGVPKNSRIID